jgi:hypothetical protein
MLELMEIAALTTLLAYHRRMEMINSVAVTFDTKETVIERNSVKIEAFPSHHLDAMRGLPNVSFILLDEADFSTKLMLEMFLRDTLQNQILTL